LLLSCSEFLIAGPFGLSEQPPFLLSPSISSACP
jgi:hypothetical protein